jgi:hypothetical protein
MKMVTIFCPFPSNGAPAEWNWEGKTEVLGENPVPVPLCPPQIPHGLSRDQTFVNASPYSSLVPHPLSQFSAAFSSTCTNQECSESPPTPRDKSSQSVRRSGQSPAIAQHMTSRRWHVSMSSIEVEPATPVFKRFTNMCTLEHVIFIHKCTKGALTPYAEWTDYGWATGESRCDSCSMFLLSKASRPALDSNQSPTQWVPKALSPAVKWPGRVSKLPTHVVRFHPCPLLLYVYGRAALNYSRNYVAFTRS